MISHLELDLGYRWGQIETVFGLELLLSQLGLDLGFQGASTILGLEFMWLMGMEWKSVGTLMGLEFISGMGSIGSLAGPDAR